MRGKASQRYRPFTPAVCLLVALITTACVVPMPIESVGEQVNLPPYSLPNFVQPPPSQLIEFDPQEDSVIEFNSGPIGDPNPNDRLSWRWFLDYREATFNRPIELSEASGATPDELSGGISKTIRPCAEPTFSLLSDDTLHRVELVVADRPFITSQPDDPRPNQTLPADAQFFRLVWYVRLDRSLCP